MYITMFEMLFFVSLQLFPVFLTAHVFGYTTFSKTAEPPLISRENWVSFRDEKCFRFYRSKFNFEGARYHCKERGGTLASVHSQAESSHLNAMATIGAEYGWYWLGGFRVGHTWAWDDYSPFNYTNWYNIIPNPHQTGEDDDKIHAFYDHRSKWNQHEQYGTWNNNNGEQKLPLVRQIKR